MSEQKSSGAPSPLNIGVIITNARLSWRLLNDPRVPSFLKVAFPVVIGLYVISPIDFIPDFIPVLGQADDAVVLLFGIQLFINLCPRQVVDEHRRALGLAVGDTERTLPAVSRNAVNYNRPSAQRSPQSQPEIGAETTRLEQK